MAHPWVHKTVLSPYDTVYERYDMILLYGLHPGYTMKKRQSTLAMLTVLVLLLVDYSCSFQAVLPWRCHTLSVGQTLMAKKKDGLDKGFQILELASGVLPQGNLVTVASASWKFIWKRMMAELAPQDRNGAYQRPSYTFRSPTTSLLLNDDDDNDATRYHLYTGNPCPWCHRAVLARSLLDLENSIGWTELEDNPRKASRGGWIFASARPDRIFGGCKDLRELYDTLCDDGYKGRCTAPLLVDTNDRKIVSNESSEIIRLLNHLARRRKKKGSSSTRIDLVPASLEEQIDNTNTQVYNLVNNGVYRCGFATTQQAYDAANADVLKGLTYCEDLLSNNPYLCGSEFTEADLRLLPTVLRFDGVYAPLFRAGGTHTRLRSDYPAIHQWLQRCWTTFPAVRESIDIADACGSYYAQLFPLNPSGILPAPVSAKALGLEDVTTR